MWLPQPFVLDRPADILDESIGRRRNQSVAADVHVETTGFIRIDDIFRPHAEYR